LKAAEVLKVCLDLNVWCGAFIARRLGREDTATMALTDAVRSGQSPRGAIALVISWGMLERLRTVLTRDLGFTDTEAVRLTDLIASYAKDGPSLTLGGVGIIPIHDVEDRHVLETAWAGQADILVTANLADFTQAPDQIAQGDRIFELERGGKSLILAHPFEAIRWLREEP
jgi:predicted nucleic acid-binding protein